MMRQIQKGAIYWTELGEPTTPGILGKRRPCIVFSNKYARPFSPPWFRCCPWPRPAKKDDPVPLQIEVPGIIKPSTVLSESITSVPKSALLGQPIYQLDEETLKLLNKAVAIQLAQQNSPSLYGPHKLGLFIIQGSYPFWLCSFCTSSLKSSRTSFAWSKSSRYISFLISDQKSYTSDLIFVQCS